VIRFDLPPDAVTAAVAALIADWQDHDESVRVELGPRRSFERTFVLWRDRGGPVDVRITIADKYLVGLKVSGGWSAVACDVAERLLAADRAHPSYPTTKARRRSQPPAGLTELPPTFPETRPTFPESPPPAPPTEAQPAAPAPPPPPPESRFAPARPLPAPTGDGFLDDVAARASMLELD
jgi:hypothetical protein